MSWTLFEVWAVEDGHEELVDTTNSKSEAMAMAQDSLRAGAEEAIVYQENEDGDLIEIKRFKGL